MDCPRESRGGEELMMSYTSGILEPQDQIELERHLSVCEGCRKLAADQRAMWNALDGWHAAAISEDFDTRLYRRISEEESAPAWRRVFRMPWVSLLRPAVPVAAACIALMVAFLVKEPAHMQHAPGAQPQKISIEQVERALDDMDMLKQLSAPAAPEEQATEKI